MPTTRKVSKATEKNFAMLIPKDALELKQRNINAIISSTPNEELHEKYTQMAGIFKMVDTATRVAFKKRLIKLKNKIIKTATGKITYHERSNYSFEEDKIKLFMKKHKIPVSKMYNVEHSVVTRNKKILRELVSKGILTKVHTLDKEKFSALAEVHPTLLNYVEDNFTTYIKGL
jgi:hypothetical protein